MKRTFCLHSGINTTNVLLAACLTFHSNSTHQQLACCCYCYCFFSFFCRIPIGPVVNAVGGMLHKLLLINEIEKQWFCYCRVVFAAPKSIQATVTILENLHIILEKTPQDDIRSEILPLLFNAFESSTIQVQVNILYNIIHI